MNQNGRARILAVIVGAIIGGVIGYSVGQSGLGALIGAGIGAGLLALVSLQFWVGLARFGQIAVLLPWVRVGDAVKLKEEWEKKGNKKAEEAHSSKDTSTAP